ncbi:hypothetical protein JTE90_021619 [Oedothorax gibbosus]|uniref:Uncharacterized protein n=1 Tax=Oedothorax gibbosus TaxID=931172 RepID=A0AAV6VP24_9ARAC|nr:hypothetical protein JTE90_021619 [Oedothorax gibbosus]
MGREWALAVCSDLTCLRNGGRGNVKVARTSVHCGRLTATGYKMVTYDTKIGVKGALRQTIRDVILLMKPYQFYDRDGWMGYCAELGFTLGFIVSGRVYGGGTNIGLVN